jgi:putative flippase GtrA
MKIIRYFFVGGAAAALDLSIFLVFAKFLGFNYLVVGCVGFILATMLNYVLSVRHVFESGVRFSKRKEILLVYAVSAVGLTVHQIVLYGCVSHLMLELMMSKLIATFTVFLWNFAARNYFVFRESR